MNTQESSLADIITEKLNGFKEELLTEIKLLIKSEVTKGRIWFSFHANWEAHNKMRMNEKDDLEQYGRCVCLRIEDVLVAIKENAEEVFQKIKNLLK